MATKAKPNDVSVVCKSVSDIPKEPHWAIVTECSNTIPGYNQGDATETLHYTVYTAYFNKNEWQREVIRLTDDNHRMTPRPFTAMEVKPAKIKVTIDLVID
jgi:hypothetical protein